MGQWGKGSTFQCTISKFDGPSNNSYRCIYTVNYNAVVLIYSIYWFPFFSQSDFKEYHTDSTVKFVVKMTPEKLAAAEEQGLHKVFKLQSNITTNTMVSISSSSPILCTCVHSHSVGNFDFKKDYNPVFFWLSIGVVWSQWLHKEVWEHHRNHQGVLWCPLEPVSETKGLLRGSVDGRGKSSGKYCQIYYGEDRRLDNYW